MTADAPGPPGRPDPTPPPAGVRTTGPSPETATRVVLVRHGEAVCNVSGVVGGTTGCSGLTVEGRRQVQALRQRLAATGELTGTAALYASVLPRAIETAEGIRPALDGGDGPPLTLVTDCDLCELHPGEADGLTWWEFTERFTEPDWDEEPGRPLAPGAESWTSFVDRAAGAVARLALAHLGQLIVVVCHAGVIEATLLRFLPAAPDVTRLKLRTDHASMTEWERSEGRWLLRRYNDVAPVEVDGSS
ncbi:MAG TPA: histidine phosphatase family protein [Acidimicrobiales bacterium]|nr:histidine phosphatase family protein [Acidimicrobiales bacterium]